MRNCAGKEITDSRAIFKAGLIAEWEQLRKRVQVNLMSLIKAAEATEEEEEVEEEKQTVTEAKSTTKKRVCVCRAVCFYT